jgi:hypothetical protein
MRPDKLSIVQLFVDRAQYLIPLFQRGYVWNLTNQIQPLWEDLIDRAEAIAEFKSNADKVGNVGKLRALRKHFLGTVVVGSAKGGGAETIPTREVIDGQQRITTLQILLLAFRDVIKIVEDEALDYDLKQLTRNLGKYREKTHHLKVWPTNAGRDVMQMLAELESFSGVCERFPVKGPLRQQIDRPLMVQAYLFFYTMLIAQVKGLRYDDLENAEKDNERTIAHAVIRSIEKDNIVWLPGDDKPYVVEIAHLLHETLRDGFQIMSLELEDEDDPQIIFETLNARGAPLQPSDLVRNFLFLQATRKGEAVDELYENYWKSFDDKPDGAGVKGAKFWRQEERQGRLKSVRLDLLLYHYVSLRKCEEIKVSHVFQEFKDWWESIARDTDIELKRIALLAKYFEVFLLPNQTSRFDLFCRRMRLFDTSTLTPLVFYFLEHNAPDSADMVQILNDLESYIVRRLVCGLTTKGYNRIFTSRILAELAKKGLHDANSLRVELLALSGDSQRWPDDGEFEQGWCYRPIYQGKNTSKVRAILEALELGKRTSKQEYLPLPDGLTVEHVMPQKWQTHWPISIDSAEAIANRTRLLHSIGNLTLVTGGFNSSLSNEPFKVKRPEIVTTSLLMINTYFQKFSNEDTWEENNITDRASDLFPLAKSIWSKPY